MLSQPQMTLVVHFFTCEATYTFVNLVYGIVTIIIQMHAFSTIEQETGNELEFTSNIALVFPGAAGCQFI